MNIIFLAIGNTNMQNTSSQLIYFNLNILLVNFLLYLRTNFIQTIELRNTGHNGSVTSVAVATDHLFDKYIGSISLTIGKNKLKCMY